MNNNEMENWGGGMDSHSFVLRVSSDKNNVTFFQ